MFSKPWFWILAIISAVAALFFLSPQFSESRHAISTTGRTLSHARFRQVPVLLSGIDLFKAKHNRDVIERAMQCMATIGSNTLVFRDIARIAAGSDHECARLESVLDLAIVKQSDSSRIIELAQLACRLKTPSARAAWQKEYDDLRATAEFTTVEEALQVLRQ